MTIKELYEEAKKRNLENAIILFDIEDEEKDYQYCAIFTEENPNRTLEWRKDRVIFSFNIY